MEKMKKKIIFLLALALLSFPLTACGSSEQPTDNQPAQTQTPPKAPPADAQQPEQPASAPESDPAPEAPPVPAEPEKPKLTKGQENALSAANNYLAFTAFSHSGLIEQLEYEGYSTEDATFAADNCGANWNEQAAKKAAEYLDFTSFSRSGLVEQLEYEGFTAEQAEHGASAAYK